MNIFKWALRRGDLVGSGNDRADGPTGSNEPKARPEVEENGLVADERRMAVALMVWGDEASA